MFRFMKLFQINKGMALWSVTPLLSKEIFLKNRNFQRGKSGGGKGQTTIDHLFPQCVLCENYMQHPCKILEFPCFILYVMARTK